MLKRKVSYLLIFISLILIDFIACNVGDKKNEINVSEKINYNDSVIYEDYNAKIKPVLNFLTSKNVSLSNGCQTVFIVFTNRCNACTKSTLNSIEKDARANGKKVTIIINQPNFFLEKTIQKSLSNIPRTIIIDSSNYLEKKGVSFAKNLSVDICNQEIKSCKFY